LISLDAVSGVLSHGVNWYRDACDACPTRIFFVGVRLGDSGRRQRYMYSRCDSSSRRRSGSGPERRANRAVWCVGLWWWHHFQGFDTRCRDDPSCVRTGLHCAGESSSSIVGANVGWDLCAVPNSIGTTTTIRRRAVLLPPIHELGAAGTSGAREEGRFCRAGLDRM